MVRLSLITALMLVVCKWESPPAEAAPKKPVVASKLGLPVARGTLKRAKIVTAYAVAVGAGSDPAALVKLAREKGPNLDVKRASLSDVFSADELAFLTRHLPQAEADGVKAAPAVIVLRGSGTDGLKLARELAGITRDVADAAHGWVVDPETLSVYPAAAFHEHVPGAHPDVRKLIVVHAVMGDNKQPFLDTMGLHRYGFPELYVPEAATGQIDQVTELIDGAAQVLLDGGDVDGRGELAIDFHRLGWKPNIIGGATGKAVWKTRWARVRDDGDDADLVVELVPPSGAGPEGAAKLIDECFGHNPEQIAMLKPHDPELMAAARRARAELGKLRPHFAKGIPIDERLTVKAKFTDEKGQVEWMWVDVVAFRGNVLEGTLANDPEKLTALHLGQKVKVKLAAVADYLHEKEGGKRAGGYSIEVMKQRGLLPAGADD